MNDSPEGTESSADAGAWERLVTNWNQARARLQMQWGRLTDDQLAVIEGRRELLLGQMQQSYGIDRAEAERQLADWERAEERRAAAGGRGAV